MSDYDVILEPIRENEYEVILEVYKGVPGDGGGTGIIPADVLRTYDVIDALDSILATQPLSANMGRVLKGLIDQINAILYSPDTTLDEIAEIVSYIKQNRSTLSTLSIPNIAGLESALSDLVDDIQTAQSAADAADQKAQTHIDNIDVHLAANEKAGLAGANGLSALNPVATMNDVGTGTGSGDLFSSVETAFTQSIPFDKSMKVMEVDQTSDLIFTPDPTGAVNGNACLVTLNGDSTHSVDLSAFIKSGGSLDFDNTKRNLITFRREGGRYWYRVIEQFIVTPGGTIPAITRQNRIYPNAIGYGTLSRGAYGGLVDPQILIVDSLSGAYSGSGNRGTLRWALEQTFPRIIVFEVEGVIDNDGISWRIQVENPYVNVYGQTAPGKGVTIAGTTLWLQSTDMLFQHIRVRPGDHSNAVEPNTIDAVNMYHGCADIVFDHCSLGWSQDELVGTKDTNRRITFNECMFAEPFDQAGHRDEGTGNAERHPYGALMYAGDCTFNRNLFAFTFGRNPLVRQGDNAIINNYIYAALYSAPMIESIGFVLNAAIVGNVTEPIPYDGVMQPASEWAVYNVSASFPAGSNLYVEDNIGKMNTDNPALTQWECVRGNTGIPQSLTPNIDLSDFDILPSSQVKAYVLANAGAFPWNRDITDQAVIDRILASETNLRHSVANYPATARNLEGTATSGDMTSGFDWSATPQTLVLSYNAVLDGPTLGPTTLNLTANCVDQDAVVTHINSVLPAGLVCTKIGRPGYEANQVQIQTSHANANSFIEVHDTGTGHATLGIAPGQFHGAEYVGYETDTSTAALTIPADPHTDPDSNSYTELEEWAWEMNFQEDGGVDVEPWAVGGGPETDPVFSNSTAGSITALDVANWDSKAAGLHTHAISEISGAGTFAEWDVWEGDQTAFDALGGVYVEKTLYLVEGTLIGSFDEAGNYSPTGDWNFTGGLTYNGVPIATTADIGGNVAPREVTASFAVLISDVNGYIYSTAATDIDATVDNNLAVGDVFTVRQAAAGTVTLIPDSGVTIEGNLSTSGLDSTIQCIKVADNLYHSISGALGKSAYEIAVENGFVGTEAEWLTSLQGTDGVDGADGDDADMSVVVRTEAAAFTLSAADVYVKIRYTGATDINVTVPSTLLPTCSILIRQAGAGVVTLVPDTGGTLNGDTKTAGQHSSILIEGVSTNVNDVTGGIA